MIKEKELLEATKDKVRKSPDRPHLEIIFVGKVKENQEIMSSSEMQWNCGIKYTFSCLYQEFFSTTLCD